MLTCLAALDREQVGVSPGEADTNEWSYERVHNPPDCAEPVPGRHSTGKRSRINSTGSSRLDDPEEVADWPAGAATVGYGWLGVRAACSRSRKGTWAGFSFRRASSRANHSTRSISGNVSKTPECGGHSIV